MRLFQALAFSPLFISPVFAQELISRLNQLGLDGFARMLIAENPPYLADLCNRNDFIIWAPGNARVAAHPATLVKRTEQGSGTAAHGSASTPSPRSDSNGVFGKRQFRPAPEPVPVPLPLGHQTEVPPVYPDTVFEIVLTFLNDSNGMNLGSDQRAAFTKNFASPLDGGPTTASIIEVVSGLGNTQHTVRGPFSFANGVIYEVSDFFTWPRPFTTTMEHINLAQRFYNIVVSSGKLSVFENTTAITVFAPIDANCPHAIDNLGAYIIQPPLLAYTPGLRPGRNFTAMSGDALNVTWGPGGDRFVNGRRIVKANIPIENGVLHFIDGPLP